MNLNTQFLFHPTRLGMTTQQKIDYAVSLRNALEEQRQRNREQPTTHVNPNLIAVQPESDRELQRIQGAFGFR